MSSESSSQEGAGQKPKGPLSVKTAMPGRDRPPLFTGRRPGRLESEDGIPQDFITDSLNTSYLPIPSPTKTSSRPSSSTTRGPGVTKHNARSGLRINGGVRKDENRLPSFASPTSSSESKKTTTPAPRRASLAAAETSSSLAGKTTPPSRKTGEGSPRVKRNSIGSIREKHPTKIPRRPDSSLSRPESSFSSRDSIRTRTPSPTKSRHESVVSSDVVIRSRTPSPRKRESTLPFRPTLRSRTPSPPKRQNSLRSPEGYTEAHTPSPPRGFIRQDSLVSPISSASSPPQGLAESYQRIEEQEFLAGQEGEHEDDLSFTDGEFTMDQSENQDPFPKQPASMGSPISRHSSKSSLRKVVSNSSTQQSYIFNGSDEGSSLLDDTFNMPLSHATDEERLKAALGEEGVAFKKARSRAHGRTGLTAENLQRKDAASPQSGSSTLGSPSVSSRASEPPLNIPKTWGQRGDKKWLNRLDRSGGKLTGDLPKIWSLQDDKAPEAGKRSSSPILDWIDAAADAPLASVENEPRGSHSLASRGSSSSLKKQISLGQIRELEAIDSDTTGRFYQTGSTSARRNAALDQIREREIETLSKNRVTTNRLNELHEKKSLDAIRRRTPSVNDDLVREDSREETEQRRKEWSSSPEKQLKPKPRTQSEAPVYANNDMMDGAINNKANDEASKLPPSKSEGDKEPTTQPSRRPNHDQQESRELLCTFTTSTSFGGSPPRSTAQSKMEQDGKILNDSKESRLNTGASSRPETQQQDGDAGNGEHVAKKDSQPQSTPQQPKQDPPSKTPLVTGHWVDTPLPAGRGLPVPTPNDTEDEKELGSGFDAAMIKLGAEDLAGSSQVEKAQRPSLADTAPKLPKSVLSSILEKAKNKKAMRQPDPGKETTEYDTLQLDDSTIQSLEEIVAHDGDTLNLDDSTIQSLEEILAHDGGIAHVEAPPLASPTRQKALPSKPSTSYRAISKEEEDEEAEAEIMKSYNHLPGKLSRALSSVIDARKGIGSLERRVDSFFDKRKAVATTDTDECHEGGEFHDFIWPCQKCGCPGGRQPLTGLESGEGIDWHVVRLPMPRIWYWRKEDYLPRFTWTGLVLFIVTALLVGEWYCYDCCTPPFYAHSTSGYGFLGEHYPRPPFLLAKFFWRSPIAYPFKLLWWAFCFGVEIVARQWVGYEGRMFWEERPRVWVPASEGPWPGDGLGWGFERGSGSYGGYGGGGYLA